MVVVKRLPNLRFREVRGLKLWGICNVGLDLVVWPPDLHLKG